MSRSIKQYKEAMDSIKLSESFSKRTENLLMEAEERETMSPVRQNKKSGITIALTACAGLAACFIAVMTAKPAANDSSMIESGGAGVTAVTSSVSAMTEEPEETAGAEAAIIVSLEEDGENMVRENDPAVEILGGKDNSAPTDDTADCGAAAAGAKTSHGGEGLYALDYSQVEAELVSYVNGGKFSSVTLTGDNARNLVSPVAYVVYGTEEMEENDSFVSEFVLILNDKSSGDTFYTIYLSDAGTVILTDHTGEEQVRKTFMPEKKNYEDIEKAMFLCFGKESEYERFAGAKNAADDGETP